MWHIAELIQTLGFIKGFLVGGLVFYCIGYMHCKWKNRK